MFTLPAYFYDINIISVLTRSILAVLIGGIIGLERGSNRHPAGFRTHILVCVGATLAMMTNQYIVENFPTGDPARLGAQVITGVGFLGVGTILVTGRYKIKGLTTAAGLWASACLGLAIGIGFYSGAIIASIVIFICLAILPPIENFFYDKSKVLNFYVEIDSVHSFKELNKYLRTVSNGSFKTDISETPPAFSSSGGGISMYVSMHLPKTMSRLDIITRLEVMDGVLMVEEIS